MEGVYKIILKRILLYQIHAPPEFLILVQEKERAFTDYHGKIYLLLMKRKIELQLENNDFFTTPHFIRDF